MLLRFWCNAAAKAAEKTARQATAKAKKAASRAAQAQSKAKAKAAARAAAKAKAPASQDRPARFLGQSRFAAARPSRLSQEEQRRLDRQYFDMGEEMGEEDEE